jgi:hypothetical protein
LSELESLLLTPWALPYLIVLDVAILVATFVAFARVAERTTQARQEPSGVWSYQIGFSIAAIFLGAFVLRLVLAIVLFPSSLAFGSPPGGYATEGQQLVLATVDGLFSAITGPLVGRPRCLSKSPGGTKWVGYGPKFLNRAPGQQSNQSTISGHR